MNVNELIRAREESSNVPYQEFIKLVREYPNELVCFFEGKDNPQYCSVNGQAANENGWEMANVSG